jgi:hypothetical protein
MAPAHVLVVDPERDRESRTVSHWSAEEILRFAHAKCMTYIGDHKAASNLLSELVEPTRDLVFELHRLGVRQTAFGEFVGSEQVRIMPDGRQVRLRPGARVVEQTVEQNRANHAQQGQRLQTTAALTY